MPTIGISFEKLRHQYPRRPGLTPELKRFMSYTPGTPCCVQMCHALNMAGEYLEETFPGQRRKISKIDTDGITYNYVLAVDEMEAWLTYNYDPGEEVHKDEDGKRRNVKQIKDYLRGRMGILVFRNDGYGFHTELWDGKDFVQTDMDRGACLSQKRVLFWDCGPPQWLQDYMGTQT